MHVNADHLAVLLHVGDNVVDGDLRGGACGGGHGDDGHALILGGCNALERTHVGEFGIVDDNAYRLGGIH